MPKENGKRSIGSHLKEICEKYGITLTAFSGNWIFCLEKNDIRSFIYGYDFGLNSATAKLICKDKSATSDLLDYLNVPRIEHQIFHSPRLSEYVPSNGNWKGMLAYLEDNPDGVVCKPNEGTGGASVFIAKTPVDLEKIVHSLFSKSRSICLSPFVKFENEYRVAILLGKAHFAYRKVRPQLIGDGSSSTRILLLKLLQDSKEFEADIDRCKNFTDMKINWDEVPALGEVITLNWRHNLGQGAQPQFLQSDTYEWEAITSLALRAAHALGVDLASVDIAETESGFQVLELNSGIMMESLTENHSEGANIARDFYESIIRASLKLDSHE